MREGSVDAVIDEGINTWLHQALELGYEPVQLEDHVFEHLTALGWRRVPLPAGWDQRLKADSDCIDYSGWPVYTRESMPDEGRMYKVCEALAARADEVPWEESYESVALLGLDREAGRSTCPSIPAPPSGTGSREYRSSPRLAGGDCRRRGGWGEASGLAALFLDEGPDLVQ